MLKRFTIFAGEITKKNTIMEYSNEFVNLVNTTQETMIGVGNPNARILIIACEPSISKDNYDQIEREIRKNKEQWLSI